MQDLLGRLEVPNERNRWDKPLFHVFPDGVFIVNICSVCDELHR